MRRRPLIATIAAASVAGLLQVAGATPSSAAPGDVAAVTAGLSGISFRPEFGELAEGVAADGSVLFHAIRSTEVFYGHFVRRPDGTVIRVEVTDTGTVAIGEGFVGAALSDDGRYAAFASRNGVLGVFDGDAHLFLKDLDTGSVLELADLGVPTPGCPNRTAMVVADGAERVMFSTTSSLDPADSNGVCDVYVWEAVTGTARRLTSGSASVNGMGSVGLAMTPDGRHLIYVSDVDTPRALLSGSGDLWLLDVETGSRSLQSLDTAGDPLALGVVDADLSDDASVIAFESYSDPTGDQTFAWRGVYVRYADAGVVLDTTPRSLTVAANPTISGDGTRVAAEIDWSWLNGSGQDPYPNVGVYDIHAASWQLASHRSGEASVPANAQSSVPLIGPRGDRVAFTSYATDLTAAPAPASRGAYVYEVTGLAPPDSDADGILDVVDADDGDGSLPGQFEDVIAGQDPTSGVITSVAAGMTVTVTDEADPSGVLVSVSGTVGSARLTVCGAFGLSLRAGTTTALTCGSVRTRVDSGEVVVVLPDGVTVTVPAGVEAYVDDLPDGSFAVDVLAAGPGQTVTVDNGGATSSVGLDDPVRVVRTWTFLGFAAPVDGGTTVNVAKSGSVVPLRWTLQDSSGPVAGLSQATATFARLDCTSGAALDVIEEVASRPSGLLDLGGGAYQLNWRTPSGPGCGQLRLDVGDGVVHVASFRLR